MDEVEMILRLASATMCPNAPVIRLRQRAANPKCCAKAFAAVLVSLGAVSVLAQPAQTPRSAQNFLAQVLPSTPMRLITHDGMQIRTPYVVKTYIPSETDACLGQWTIQKSETDLYPLDYRYVREVQHEGSEVIILRADPKGVTIKYILTLYSPSIAARVGYAMDFIRQSCDPTTETGF